MTRHTLRRGAVAFAVSTARLLVTIGAAGLAGVRGVNLLYIIDEAIGAGLERAARHLNDAEALVVLSAAGVSVPGASDEPAQAWVN